MIWFWLKQKKPDETDLLFPKRYDAYVHSWKEKHPTWSVRVWTQEELYKFVKERDPQIMTALQSFTHDIQRIDFLKVYLLYVLGGWYVDMDMRCLGAFDDLQNEKLVLTFDSSYYTYSNAIMGSEPFHPFCSFFMGAMLNHTAKYRFEPKNLFIIRSTGPIQLTRCVLYCKMFQKESISNLRTLGSPDVSTKHSTHTARYARHDLAGEWTT